MVDWSALGTIGAGCVGAIAEGEGGLVDGLGDLLVVVGLDRSGRRWSRVEGPCERWNGGPVEKARSFDQGAWCEERHRG